MRKNWGLTILTIVAFVFVSGCANKLVTKEERVIKEQAASVAASETVVKTSEKSTQDAETTGRHEEQESEEALTAKEEAAAKTEETLIAPEEAVTKKEEASIAKGEPVTKKEEALIAKEELVQSKAPADNLNKTAINPPPENFFFADIHFDFDEDILKDEARASLKKGAEWLVKNKDLKIVIEGNCDERGTAEYNLALGQRRAAAAAKYLINLGVDAQRIKIVSYGFELPVDPRHNEEAWAKNRRDHFVVSGQ